ncbi:MAG: hypothetical protein UZ22_OP11002001146 [Microgenomates bacterium OLB23]|nr:MAG: hypothetical protein UZ22_OP11002001146 [Microgenomates bacterium OLB23]
MNRYIQQAVCYVLLYGVLTMLITRTTMADSMDSNQFRIRYSNINFGSNDGTSTNYDLSTTNGQLAAKEFSSAGYIVKAGFQYWHSIIPFSFSISDIGIELGSLTPQTPSTATTTLTVSFGGAGQYQVTAGEVGTLQTANGANSIADTTCNGGAQTCTESSANVWNSASAYGFGYNMSGTGIPGDFVNNTYYRPFPDLSLSESPAVVMSSSSITTSSQSTVTFKVNVSTTQAAGTYQTLIKFVATPSF